ncbi:MAG: DNA-binding protein, partial [Dysgonamonadaceae bacterium]|nr:DNA-binding protein [Dysgonamonadaceae bacterium]
MKRLLFYITLIYLNINILPAQDLKQLWQSPPEESRPWTFWYWMQGAISKEGITADLEAMKEVGIGGAYLMPIKGVPEKPFITPVIEQLSPLWWEMVTFAFSEADRLDFKLAFHVCDGFALAGGPWITSELSMQKVVWSKISVTGKKKIDMLLPRPESYKDYYEDIAIFAYPAPAGNNISSETLSPEFSTNCNFFIDNKTQKTSIRSEEPCWIQYAFNEPFTCRSIQIKPSGRDFQSQRLIIETSNDGVNFSRRLRLEPPRQGWQNYDIPATYSIPPVTARYFRFLYDPEGTEPGAEDLDAAKWKPSLKMDKIILFSEAQIHQYEGKNGEVWRVSPHTTKEQIPDELCVDMNKMIDITSYVENGRLQWNAPKGQWTILRIGHTATGHTNATGGKGIGLECDKFNPEAIRLQFNSWFGKMTEIIGEERASRVLKIFHVDSWECGSQNWSPVFREEFKKRRGYDIKPYLPVMAGVPVESAETSEKVLHDVRQTISELVTDVFYKILQEEAHKKNCSFSAESVAPTMVSDGMMHYRNTDIPMGEFWFESPTHDKLNDVLDAVSGAHIYGKNIIQAEAFTQLRSNFTEYPALLKSLQDRNYAMGINRLTYHVYTLNPWIDRKPGMTLDGIGLYFQRDQTWWKQGRAWIDYARRCQALLQFGRPVTDIAVFTGEEVPRRAILPDRLLPFIPGIFGKEKVCKEQIRLANKGLPMRQMPVGVSHSANILRAEDWVNPLRGYAYDSFNRDVLLQAKAENGEIVFPSGAKYKAIIVPGKHPMQPNPEKISSEVKLKISELTSQGVIQIPLFFDEETFDSFGIERDFVVTENTPEYAAGIAYTHRQKDDTDIYFVSNQSDSLRNLKISLRVSGKIPELWNPVNGSIRNAEDWKIENGRTALPLRLDAGESVFVVLQKEEYSHSALDAESPANHHGVNQDRNDVVVLTVSTPWTIRFDEKMRGPKEPVVLDKLIEWNEFNDEKIRYYSGTALYSNTFRWNETQGTSYFLELENMYNIASVKINGTDCGTIWTKPYRIDISAALRQGENRIEIEVSNTW